MFYLSYRSERLLSIEWFRNDNMKSNQDKCCATCWHFQMTVEIFGLELRKKYFEKAISKSYYVNKDTKI